MMIDYIAWFLIIKMGGEAVDLFKGEYGERNHLVVIARHDF